MESLRNEILMAIQEAGQSSSESESDTEPPISREQTFVANPNWPTVESRQVYVEKSQISNSWIWAFAVFGGLISLAMGFYYVSNAPPAKCELILDDELDRLKPEFKFQNENDWFLLAAGIEKIKDFEPHRPSTFILIHRNSTPIAERLASTMGSLASQFLSNCANKQAIILNGANIEDNLIERYRRDLDRSHVMVVLGLEKMKAERAFPFHSLCDEYNPVVGNSAFFFTLQVDQSEWGKSAGKMAKNRLYDIWKNSRDDFVSGLVTRLTHNVIQINEDET